MVKQVWFLLKACLGTVTSTYKATWQYNTVWLGQHNPADWLALDQDDPHKA